MRKQNLMYFCAFTSFIVIHFELSKILDILAKYSTISEVTDPMPGHLKPFNFQKN